MDPVVGRDHSLYIAEPDVNTGAIAEIPGDTTEYLDYVGIYGDNISQQ